MRFVQPRLLYSLLSKTDFVQLNVCVSGKAFPSSHQIRSGFSHDVGRSVVVDTNITSILLAAAVAGRAVQRETFAYYIIIIIDLRTGSASLRDNEGLLIKGCFSFSPWPPTIVVVFNVT